MATTHEGITLPTVIRTRGDLRDFLAERRRSGRRIGFVPTMGAFHEGHLSLMRLAGQGDDHDVVVSLFVNPTQFAPTEDLSKYPRDEERDLRMAAEAGAGIVFAPPVDEIYPDGFGTTITVSGPTATLEGASRPDHFSGVATVVAKLLNIVSPDRVVFGQKDAQQVAVVRRLIEDLDFDVELVVGPIVREDDGLAMSSRNAYLNADERRAATVLRRALDMAEVLHAGGERHPHVLEAVALATLEDEPLCEPEYATIVHPDSFSIIDDPLDGPALLCLAAKVGPARLIDNTTLSV